MSTAVLTFIGTLKKSGLIPANRWQSAYHELQELGTADDKVLARHLIERGLLTRFQAVELLQGRYRRLRVENYNLLQVVGVGGMGTVYRAVEADTGRQVALKILAERFKHDAGMRARFEMEARAGMRVEHPHLVRSLEIGTTDDVFGEMDFVVMELFEGMALHELIGLRKGPLPWTAACDVLSQAATALEYLHRQGMVHRDVKPDNLLINKEGHVKLLDFGLAFLGSHVRDDEFSLSMIFGHDCIGTADYMPPEQADDSMHADARSDIYSLGCTFYGALTGRRPFKADSRSGLLNAHRTVPVPSARDVNADIPPDVDAIVGRMMAKSPADRFQSMQEVADAVAPFAQRQPFPFDFEAVLQERAKLAARKERDSRVAATLLRQSSMRRVESQVPTQSPIETTVEKENPQSASTNTSAAKEPEIGVNASHAAEELIDQFTVRTPDATSAVVPAELILEDGKRVPLVSSGYSIGRGSQNDLHFDAGDLSNRHCQLSFDGEKWWVTDLGSKNGVRVNGDRIKDHPVRPGDLIQLASTVSFRIHYRPSFRSGHTWQWLTLSGIALLLLSGLLYWLLG